MNKASLFLAVCFTIQLTAQQFQWVTPSSSTLANQYANQILLDDKGNSYVLAQNNGPAWFANFPADSGQAVIKYDNLGAVTAVINLNFTTSGFGVDNAGNLYFTNQFTGAKTVAGYTLTGKGGKDHWFMKTSPSGNPQWLTVIGSDNRDIVTVFKVDGEGNVYVTGYFNGSMLQFGSDSLANNSGAYRFFLGRIRSNGTTAWVHNGLPDAPSLYGGCSGLTFDRNGHLLALLPAANCNSCIRWFVSRYDSTGLRLSQNILDTDTINTMLASGFSYLHVDDSMNLYCQKEPYHRYGSGAIIKYGPDFKFRWKYIIGEITSCEYYSSWTVHTNGHLFLACNNSPEGGYCGPPRDHPSYDVVIKKLARNGSLLWEKKVNGLGHELVNTIATDKTGNCYIAGMYNYNQFQLAPRYNIPAAFDTYTVGNNHTYFELYTAKLASDHTLSASGTIYSAADIAIFPNPSNDLITFRSEFAFIRSIVITGITGIKLLSVFPMQAETQIDLSRFPEGLYIATITDADGRTRTEKLVKQ